MPTVTVAMATYKDTVGVIDTVQHHRINREPVDEYVVFDNDAKPLKKESQGLADLSGNTGMRLYTDPSITGTSASRNQAITMSTSDIVIVMDCHVFLAPGAVAAVKRYFANPDNRKNILSGPILFDGLDPTYAPTHFQPQWNAGMYGRWGCAWQTPAGEKFTVLENLETGTCDFKGFAGSLTLPDAPQFDFPKDLAYAGHEKPLRATGCTSWMEQAAPDATIEIPGQGLGCFAVWRENWLGFHEAASGFGGEELCVHELYRKNGGKAVCLAAFQWWHRFYRTGDAGAPYNAENWRKVRNYVLWFQRLGLPLEDIRDHFVTCKHPVMFIDEWERLVEDAVGFQPGPPAAPKIRDFGLQQAPNPESMTLESLQQWLAGVPRDFNEHIPYLSGLAAQSKAVAEFSGRRESMVALASCVGPIYTYNDEAYDGVGWLLSEVVARETTKGAVRALYRTDNGVASSLGILLPEPVDLLFLDTRHTGEQISMELMYHSSRVRKWIAIHDTELYGETGDGGSGMAAAIDAWVDSNPEWYVLLHTAQQYGLTVLSKVEETRPPARIWVTAQGPGTELADIFKSLGVALKPGCACKSRMKTMDAWGSAGCRENFDTIVGWIREAQALWGLEAGLKADGVMATLKQLGKGVSTFGGWKLAWKMLLSGTPDPIPVAVKLAISRAEAKGL